MRLEVERFRVMLGQNEGCLYVVLKESTASLAITWKAVGAAFPTLSELESGVERWRATLEGAPFSSQLSAPCCERFAKSPLGEVAVEHGGQVLKGIARCAEVQKCARPANVRNEPAHLRIAGGRSFHSRV